MIQYLVLISLPLAIIGTGAYIKDTLVGKTKPNKITWLMWSIAPLIATFAAISKGVSWAVLPVFMSGFCPLLVLIVSLFSKKSYWKLSLFDYLCGFFSVLALILWVITKEANIAIIFSIISDASAGFPTLKKAWTNPETESVLIYATGIISALTSFAAVEYGIFSEYAFPIYLLLMNTILVVLISRSKIFKKAFVKK